MGIIERVHNSLEREKIYGILAPKHLSNCQFFYVLNGLARFNEYYGHIPIDSLKIPPSRATLCPLIQRTDYVSRIYKSYNTAHPVLPAVTESGLVRGGHDTNIQIPVYYLLLPAPIAVLELVKCGCNGVCNKNHCSCFKGGVPCTSLCQCSDDCLNVR